MLEFKLWLERHYPTQMFPANRAGVRDVRFGYSMNPSENPPVISRIGSDVVTGLGSVFRRSMGAAFPSFGSGYRNYFDELTASFNDGKDFVVVRNEPYDAQDDEDDPRKTHLKRLTQSSLQKIRAMNRVIEAGNNAGVDIKDEPSIMYEPSDQDDHIKIIFRFKLQEKFSDKLRLTKVIEPGK